MAQTLADLVGSRWSGESELWLDPAGNEAIKSPCSIEIDDGVVRYRWSHEGVEHEGSFALRDGGADFTDTWHSPSPMACEAVDGWALFSVTGTYGGDGTEWGWRSSLSLRPTSQLVLQMTNIAPWGEEGRAVRMVCERR